MKKKALTEPTPEQLGSWLLEIKACPVKFIYMSRCRKAALGAWRLELGAYSRLVPLFAFTASSDGIPPFAVLFECMVFS